MNDPVEALVDCGMNLCEAQEIAVNNKPYFREQAEHDKIVFKQIEHFKATKKKKKVNNAIGWLTQAITEDWDVTKSKDNYYIDAVEKQKKDREKIIKGYGTDQIETLDALCERGLRVRVAQSLIDMKGVDHIKPYFENKELSAGDLYTAARYDWPVFMDDGPILKEEPEPKPEKDDLPDCPF